MRDANDTMPKARADGTIIDEPALDEIVVYDLSRHRAHALNQTAAVVWRHCDGRTSFGAVATALGKSLGIRPNLELVGVTVERLRRACLLEQTVAPRAVETMRSRRAALLTLGRGLLPVIATLSVPRAAHAQSCIPLTGCLAQQQPCSGQPICPPPPNKCCKASGPMNCMPKHC